MSKKKETYLNEDALHGDAKVTVDVGIRVYIPNLLGDDHDGIVARTSFTRNDATMSKVDEIKTAVQSMLNDILA